MDKNYETLGWQGISCPVPKDWNVVAISGDENKGYLRLDDLYRMRMEVKWDRVKKNRIADLQKILKEFRKEVLKKYDKNFSFKSGYDILNIEKRENYLPFIWSGKRHGGGWVSFCKTCQKVLLVHIIDNNQKPKSIIQNILPHIKDHPDKNSKFWSIYGFKFSLPEEFELKAHVLNAGLLEFSFSSLPRHIRIVRWGVANILLKNKDIKEWFAEEVSEKDIILAEDISIEDHKVWVCNRKERALKDKRLFRWLPFGKRKLEYVFIKSFFWQCELSNRIILCEFSFFGQTDGNEEDGDLHKNILNDIKCH
jgi:hypothetical protein